MNLVWASECEIGLSAKYPPIHIPAFASVSNVSFEGNLRIILTPLINEPPLFAGMKFAFLEKPKVRYYSTIRGENIVILLNEASCLI